MADLRMRVLSSLYACMLHSAMTAPRIVKVQSLVSPTEWRTPATTSRDVRIAVFMNYGFHDARSLVYDSEQAGVVNKVGVRSVVKPGLLLTFSTLPASRQTPRPNPFGRHAVWHISIQD